MSEDAQVYSAEDWEHGLRCGACGEHFVEGQPISERLDSFMDDIPVVVITCVGCAVTGAPLRD